jgi:actin-like ATPase involved in cell morphogenesis
VTNPVWILAIDFGTSFTVAVARVEGRPPEVIEIGGERRVPSVILTETNDRIVVGRIAEELSGTNPESTLRAPKSRLGDQAPVVLAGRPHQVVQLVAALLAYIYEEAVRQMGGPPTEVRLTHPAAWNRPRLNRLLEAGAKAGLPTTVLVPEPVAAALSYAAEVGVEEGDYIAVYDLGGGTFDTAVVRATAKGFEVIGRPGGDPGIGGELFDEIMVNEIGSRIDPSAWESIQVGGDPTWQRVAATLRNEARRAKETLSSHPYADVLVPLPAGLAQARITRDEYEQLIGAYVEETVTLLGRCISNAGLQANQLAAIYLVGGASRAPMVERLTAEAFPGVPVSRRGDPKTSVALGAVRAALAPGAPAAGTEPGRSTEDAAAATADQPFVLGAPAGASNPPSMAPTSQPSVPPPAAAGTFAAGGPTSAPPGAPPPPSGPPISAPPAVPGTPPAHPPPPSAPPRGAPPGSPPAPYPQGFTGGPAQPGTTTQQPNYVPPATPPERSRKGLFIGIGAAIVALALVIGGMVLLTSGGSDDTSDTTVRRRTTDEVSTTQRRTTTTEPRRTTTTAETTTTETTTAETTTAETTTATTVGSTPELEARVLEMADVEATFGSGFVEQPQPPPTPDEDLNLLCGAQGRRSESSVIKVWDNTGTSTRIVSNVDQYPSADDARYVYDTEAGLVDNCPNPITTIDGQQYGVGIGKYTSFSLNRDYSGLIVAYAPVDTSGGAQNFMQYTVAFIDGPTINYTTMIIVGRDVTTTELDQFERLVQSAEDRFYG